MPLPDRFGHWWRQREYASQKLSFSHIATAYAALETELDLEESSAHDNHNDMADVIAYTAYYASMGQRDDEMVDFWQEESSDCVI